MIPAPFYTLTQGDLTVSAVSDGQMAAPLTLLSGLPLKAVRLQLQAGIASPETIEIGAYLIRGRGHTVLVDTGTGGVNGVGGALIASLAQLGVRPEEIDTILLTHAHPDHIGGLLTAAGAPAFPVPRFTCPGGNRLTGWRRRPSPMPAIAASVTCCSSAACWRSAQNKFVNLMKKQGWQVSSHVRCPAIPPGIPAIDWNWAIPRC